ncbi:MAG TPA: PQQ-dependent sugar dehydrogenase, partial [Anaerolineae bacterium]|nr:PQQ-dependent sugar dehydrogenase [Anaerolineae bacterium]
MRRSTTAACLAFSASLLAASASTSQGAPPHLAPQALPPGYTLAAVASIQWPAEIQCVGDGRCFVASVHDPTDEERSAIWVIHPDGSQQRIYRGPHYEPQLLGEKGLTGMALHPRFEADDRIFFYWITPSVNRTDPIWAVISSIRSDGSDYHEVWRSTQKQFTDSHVAGGLVTYAENGHDYLFVAIGEFGAGKSQDLTVEQGKIHRFEIVGDTLQAAPDNPFYDTPGAVRSIWASGFRNPFRLTRDPATGEVYITENGFRCSDRVYRLVKGGNYGWPTWDWCQDNPGYVQPIYEFRPSIGVTDIEVYHGPIPGWEGKVFICGFVPGPLVMLTLAADGRLIDRQDVTDSVHTCGLALGTRADGVLLFSKQDQAGTIYAVTPLHPGPRVAAQLTSDAAQPAADRRIHYALDISNLSFANSVTATIRLPDALGYLPGSTFGGAIYDGSLRQITWTPSIGAGRALRAGFNALASGPPGTLISVTAQIVDRYGQATAPSASIVITAGSALDVSVMPGSPAIQSGQSVTYHLRVHNQAISDTTF